MKTIDRCSWPGTDELYIQHHDVEWGVPVHDSRALLEHLILDGFQAGLSWRTVLHKRDNFRRAFSGFDPDIVSRLGAKDVAKLLRDPGIIRSKVKIGSAIDNARAYLEMRAAGLDFARWAWSFTDGKPIQNAWRHEVDVPAETPLAATISAELKSKGFKFVGPTLVYAWMQAVGIVNDHKTSCFRHAEIAALAKRPEKSAR
jgi:DNA-3-methyladenine glycosylase I